MILLYMYSTILYFVDSLDCEFACLASVYSAARADRHATNLHGLGFAHAHPTLPYIHLVIIVGAMHTVHQEHSEPVVAFSYM